MNKQSKNNISQTPLNSGDSFVGQWEDCSLFGHVVASVKADTDCTLYVDFSSDGATVAYTETYTVLKNVNSIQKVATVRLLFRIRVTNTSSMNQTSLSLDCLMKDGGLVLDRVISVGQGGIPSINVITRTANAAPTDLALSNTTIIDTTAVDSEIATITTTDANSPNDSFTYILQEDLDSKFYITGDKLYLGAAVTAGNTHDITIRVLDQAGSYYEEEFTITITDFDNQYSVTMDGTTSLLKNTTATFPINGSFTLSGWYKYTVNSGLGYLFTLGSQASNTPKFLCNFNYLTDTISSFIYGASANFKGKTTVSTLTQSEWNHVAVSWKVGGAIADLRMYINGTESGTYSNATDNTLDSMTSPTAGIAAVCLPSASTLFIHNGLMDEVSFWTVELTPAEVLELYNEGIPADLLSHSQVANLWSWYRMGDSNVASSNVEDALGTAARDLTGTAIDPGTDYTTDVPS